MTTIEVPNWIFGAWLTLTVIQIGVNIRHTYWVRRRMEAEKQNREARSSYAAHLWESGILKDTL